MKARAIWPAALLMAGMFLGGCGGAAAGSDAGGWASSEEAFLKRWNNMVDADLRIDHFDHAANMNPTAYVGQGIKIDIDIGRSIFTLSSATPERQACTFLLAAASGSAYEEAVSIDGEALNNSSRTGHLFAERGGVTYMVEKFGNGSWGCTSMKSRT